MQPRWISLSAARWYAKVQAASAAGTQLPKLMDATSIPFWAAHPMPARIQLNWPDAPPGTGRITLTAYREQPGATPTTPIAL